MPHISPSSLSDADWAAITAVVYGTPTKADHAQVERLRWDPVGAKIIAAVEADARAGSTQASAVANGQLQARAEAILREGRESPSSTSRWARKTLNTSRLSARLWGSAVALACGIALVAYAPHLLRHPPSTTQYRTQAGQRATVSLSNGARLTLGPSTRVVIAGGRHDRSVDAIINGEVLFTVPHQTDAPFVVRDGHAVIRVLGTTFLVRRYATDAATRVAVAEGRVAVRTVSGRNLHASEHVLSANTFGIIDDSGGVRITKTASFDDVTALQSGMLVFQNTPLSDVVTELNRAYDVELQLADSTLARQQLTFSVSTTARSIDGVLDALLISINAHSVRTGRVIKIIPGRPAVSKPHSTISSQRSYVR